MHKVSPWLFLVIALMWLLMLVITPAVWMNWVAVVALVLIGILELTRKGK